MDSTATVLSKSIEIELSFISYYIILYTSEF